MNAQFKPVPVEDPAGLDKLLLAAGKGCALFVEQLIGRKFGTRVNLWDGADGLGAILEEQLKAAGVPNKRLPDLLTPRLVLQSAGVNPKKPYRRVKRRLKP